MPAGPAAHALDAVRLLPVQHNGRVKPFDGYCREILWQITGKPRFKREDPVATVLSILAEPDRWQEIPLLEVPFVPLREALGMDPKARQISYSDLLSTRRLMKRLPAIVEKQGRDEKLTMLENETMDLFDRFVAFSDLIAQKIPMVPSDDSRRPEWNSIADIPAWKAVVEQWRQGDPRGVEISARELREQLHSQQAAHGAVEWKIRLEVTYYRARPFRIARWLYLAAILFLLLPRARSGGVKGARINPGTLSGLGIVLLGAAFLFHAGGILLRVVVGGRPPVSNFFETMLWIPFVAVAIALVFEWVYRARFFALASAILAVILLSLSEQVPLDPSVGPVVAVLRSNLWLSVHVLTIVASYGALLLAGVLAHLYGGRFLAARGGDPQLVPLECFLYRSIQVGVVLLAAGTMLGGVWANASWGRYWGWDPKETWALITLLWFLAVLHGRFAGWLKEVRFALATIAGLFLLGMTYYGVSFYLVGLHSYAGGNAKPLPPLLIGYVIAELAFMAAVARKTVIGSRRPV